MQEPHPTIHTLADIRAELSTLTCASNRHRETLDPFNSLVLSTPFHDSEQNRYSLYFQEHTISRIFGPFKECLFDTITMQACYVEPVLMRLISAMGAIDRSSHTPTFEASMHRQQALVRYGQALAGIQKIFNTQTFHSLRLVLLAALLIFYFENLQRDTQAAQAHFKGALHLMHKQLSQGLTQYVNRDMVVLILLPDSTAL